MRCQDLTGSERARYSDDISCSLLEFKTCRIQEDIFFDNFAVDYIVVDRNDYDNIGDLFDNAGCNYEYVLQHYTRVQKQFISNLSWIRV